MKNINIKKVVAGAAALAVGASFLGAAVAAQVQAEGLEPIVKNDIIGANGMPTGTIIVGSMAQPIDVMWAGNIAAAIGAKAYTTTTTTTDPIEVPGTPGSTSTITGDGELTDNIAVTQTATAINPAITLGKNDYSILHDEDVTGKITGDKSFEIRQTEELTVNGDTGFISNNIDKKAESLMFLLEKEDVKYTATFEGNGIPFYVSSSPATASPYFKTGDKLSIYFMGKKYNIQSISSTGNKITLVELGSTNTYTTGNTIEVKGTDGTAYTLEVGNAFNNGEKIQLMLKQNGTTLKSTTFEIDDEIEFDGYELEDKITVTDIADDSSTANNDMVELSVGSGSTLELEDDKALPGYKDGSDKLWTVDIKTNGATPDLYIKSISVFNDAKRWNKTDLTKTDAGLVPGDSIEMPLGLGNIEFLGLTEEKTYTFEVGDETVKWQDTKGRDHEIFLYEDDVANSSIEVDGEEYYIDMNSTHIRIRDGPNSDDAIAGTVVVGGGTYDFDGSTGAEDIKYYLIKEGTNKIIMALDSTNPAVVIGKNSNASWTFEGTFSDYNATNGYPRPFDVNSTTWYDGNATSSTNAFAIFKVTETTGSMTTDFYIDTYTGDLAKEDDYENTDGYVAQAKYYLTTTTHWLLDQDEAADDMDMGYTNFGSLVEVDGATGKFTVPETTRELQIFVGGGMETVVEAGQPGSTIPGTTYTTITPANIDVRNLVKMDNAGVGGVKIIVGGHLVNTLAHTDDYLTQADQWVLGKNAEGNMIVAGFTAQDTEQAAKALIDIIMG